MVCESDSLIFMFGSPVLRWLRNTKASTSSWYVPAKVERLALIFLAQDELLESAIDKIVLDGASVVRDVELITPLETVAGTNLSDFGQLISMYTPSPSDECSFFFFQGSSLMKVSSSPSPPRLCNIYGIFRGKPGKDRRGIGSIQRG